MLPTDALNIKLAIRNSWSEREDGKRCLESCRRGVKALAGPLDIYFKQFLDIRSSQSRRHSIPRAQDALLSANYRSAFFAHKCLKNVF